MITNASGSVTSTVAYLSIATAHYVNANNPSPSAPYTTWATAATVIQNAVDSASVGDWVFVTNGTYNTGGKLVSGMKWNRVVMTNQVTVVSVNGPQVTRILGDVAPDVHLYGTRCVWLGNGSTLSGFTITAGGNFYGLYNESASDDTGGGILGQLPNTVVTNCIITGNTGCWYGGGANGCTLINCLVTGNNAFEFTQGGDGGGVYQCTVINCTVVSNTAALGGGVGFSTVENSIVYDNGDTTFGDPNNFASSFTNSCTSPDPGGFDNTTNDPEFVDFANGDYRLQPGSPCIDTGANAFITATTDLDGNPRVVNGTVDMGAYEFQQAPWFLLSPTNATILAGSNFVLTATALGAPFAYQWYYNGAPLADGGRILGSGSNSLSIATSVTNDSGNYWVTASNSYGVTTSIVATETELPPRAITRPPTTQPVVAGKNTSFTVTAIGYAPPNYFWYSNGIAMSNGGRISGATSATLTISNTQTNDATSYQVLVTNVYGSVTSQVATLNVILPVQIITPPASQDILPGGNATFTVTAGGTGPFTYQWYFNGSPLTDGGRISGSTMPALNISNVQAGDAGGYRVVVSNSLSSATSITASLTPQAVIAPTVRYVMLANTNPQSPYLEWSTAATNIQDAVDAAVAGDSIVVSNGMYNFGGRLVYGATVSNRVVINKSVTVQSLNGPAATTIAGFNLALSHFQPGCVVFIWPITGAFLSGFTLTGGAGATASTNDLVHERSGGGAWCEDPSAVISNCVLFANSVQTGYGGGAFGGTLINCLLATNSASSGGGAASNILLNCTLVKNQTATQGNTQNGGGAYYSTLSNCWLVANNALIGAGAFGGTLFNCVLTNNAASNGGGAASNTLVNCILVNNIARGSGGGAFNSILYNCTVVTNTAITSGGAGISGGAATNSIIYYNGTTPNNNVSNTKFVAYSCTSPSIGGVGDITNEPLFVSLAGYNFHLQSSSPCINSGNSAFVTVSNDFDGNPRIVGGTVDMGVYEYQSPASAISYAWLQQYGLPVDGSMDFTNLDGTAFNVYQDWVVGLNPTNPASAAAGISRFSCDGHYRIVA